MIDISSAQGWYDMRNDPTLDYRLINSIDLSSYADFPMLNAVFSGSLDGQGYTISNFKQTSLLLDGSNYFSGMFRNTSGTIKNFRLINSSQIYPTTPAGTISKNMFMAVLTSSAGVCLIENVIIENPKFDFRAGQSTSQYQQSTYRHGLLTSYVNAAAVIRKNAVINADSYTLVNTANIPVIGGFIGEKTGTAFIEENYITGLFTNWRWGSNSTFGGFIGTNTISINNEYIRNNYARVTAAGRANFGGFIYYATCSYDADRLKMFNNYSATIDGMTSPPYNKGGFALSLNRIYLGSTKNYFDSNIIGTTTDPYSVVNGATGANSRSTSQMKTQSTFENWDFDTIWAIDPNGIINDGYPYHLWANPPAPAVGNKFRMII